MAEQESVASARAGVSLAEATRTWAKIGVLSFGGPAGQIALMHRILVEEKKWIDEPRFLHALNFCMLLPGPEAQQLATYVGWMLHRIRGGLIAGSLFIVPGALVVGLLSLLYFTVGEQPLVRGLFEGLKPAVVVIVLEAMLRIGRRSLASVQLGLIAAGAFVAMFVFNVPFPLVIAVAGLLGALGSRSRDPGRVAAAPVENQPGGWKRQAGLAAALLLLWLVPTGLLFSALGADHVFTQIGVFFSKMAVVTFGGAYAVLAYVSQQAVESYQWLSAGQMIDGLAMAETTPGPLILVTQFVGFAAAYGSPGSLPPALAGFLGGAFTTWVTFLPCFLWIFIGAPYMERIRQNAALAGALAAVTAAVVGVILNLATWFAINVLFGKVQTFTGWGTAVELPVLASARLGSGLVTLVAAVLVFRLRASLLVTLTVTGGLGVASTLVVNAVG